MSDHLKLKLTRQIASDTDGTDYVLADDRALVVGYPRIRADHLAVIHFDSPLAPGDVILPLNGSTPVEAQIVHSQADSVFALTRVVRSEPFQTELLGVSLTNRVSERLINPLSWESLSGIWYEGETGGPQRSLSTRSPDLVSEGLAFFIPAWKRFVPLGTGARMNQVPLRENTDRVAAPLRAANNRFVVFGVAGQTFSEDVVSGSVKPLTQYLTDTGARAHLRLFGSWLCVVAAEKRSDVPGISRRHVAAASQRLSVSELYDQSVNEEHFPGVLMLVNLQTGETVTIRTGQQDSEILRVEGRMVLYRVGTKLFQSTLETGKIGAPEVVADDEAVAQVHWAFWVRTETVWLDGLVLGPIMYRTCAHEQPKQVTRLKACNIGSLGGTLEHPMWHYHRECDMLNWI